MSKINIRNFTIAADADLDYGGTTDPHIERLLAEIHACLQEIYTAIDAMACPERTKAILHITVAGGYPALWATVHDNLVFEAENLQEVSVKELPLGDDLFKIREITMLLAYGKATVTLNILFKDA